MDEIIILDEPTPEPVTLAGQVARLCAEGDQTQALVAIARAIELLQQDSHPALELAPRVEAVLRSWGYVPLVDGTTLPTPP